MKVSLKFSLDFEKFCLHSCFGHAYLALLDELSAARVRGGFNLGASSSGDGS